MVCLLGIRLVETMDTVLDPLMVYLMVSQTDNLSA